jgi:CBS domain-containing protein
MQLKVRDWMTDLPVFIDPESTISDALTIMRRRNINSLIVNKTKECAACGIITTIDICDHIVARDQNPTQVKVKDIMSSPLITVNQNLSIQECAAKMSEKRIHHMPVVNEKGDIIGMISATDFLWVAEMIGKGGG